MPYWSVHCFFCQGYIADALLECLPQARTAEAAYQQLFQARPGAALACPYCSGLFGFDDSGEPQSPESGWPVFRYGQAELESKKLADGESAKASLTDWALKHRFTQPGSHDPFCGYTYAEQSPPDETVP